MKCRIFLSFIFLFFSITKVYSADEYVLRMAHPWPATSDIHKGLVEWAQSIENASDKRIKIDMYPAQTLAKSAKLYEAAVMNIADISATVQGYSANKFPLTQIIELPGIVETAAQGTCILQTLYDEDLISQEYSETKVLLVYTNGPGQIHMRSKEVRLPTDLQGMRIRRPTTVIGTLLSNLKAQSVGLPAPDAYQSLERGIIDGVAISWDGAKVFGLSEIAPYHTELNLYSLGFVVAMNKNVYAKLPEDLQAVIDDHSGMLWSQHMAKVFDSLDKKAIEEAKSRGDVIIELDAETKAIWDVELDKVTESYLKSLGEQNELATSIYSRALDLKTKCL